MGPIAVHSSIVFRVFDMDFHGKRPEILKQLKRDERFYLICKLQSASTTKPARVAIYQDPDDAGVTIHNLKSGESIRIGATKIVGVYPVTPTTWNPPDFHVPIKGFRGTIIRYLAPGPEGDVLEQYVALKGMLIYGYLCALLAQSV